MLSKSFALLAVAAGVSARTFTVYNNCPFTMWYAVFQCLPLAVPLFSSLVQMANIVIDVTAGRLYSQISTSVVPYLVNLMGKLGSELLRVSRS